MLRKVSRKEILDRNNIINVVVPSKVDEDAIKDSLLKASPIISKNLAELKANKVSQKIQIKLFWEQTV